MQNSIAKLVAEKESLHTRIDALQQELEQENAEFLELNLEVAELKREKKEIQERVHENYRQQSTSKRP
jgi:predicted  nucleic acid-binding Zn-ribbon protein